ncbi:MAG TPA: hypothetical protein VF544_12380 [Pyrinomonadaceae bacterium]|jgi:hypothetical protein
MTEHNINNDDQSPQTQTAPGDPETAGETTAAATITGSTDTTPVGADTMANVTATPNDKGKDNN